MQPVHNTLSEEIRAQTVELLNWRLAAANDLQGQLRQAQGNVSGSAFIAVHPLSDKVAGEAENCSDLIAEPAAGLGGIADGAVQVAAERTLLIAYPSCIAWTKTSPHSPSLRRSRRLSRLPATRSDNPRPSAAPTRPISSEESFEVGLQRGERRELPVSSFRA
jgi:hypothetical protein